jgi:hypothetical protein
MFSDGCVTLNNSAQVKNESTFEDRAASAVAAEDNVLPERESIENQNKRTFF